MSYVSSSAVPASTPGSFIKGNLTVLRPANLGFSEDELRRRYEWSRDEDLQYWSGSIPTARTFGDFQSILPERDWPRDGHRRSYAILESTGELIGMVSCYGIDWSLGTGELGVYIGERNLWNKGLGTDAIVALLRHLFFDLGLRTIYLNTYATNTRAIRSYRKAGFRQVSVRKRFRPTVGYYREVRMVMAFDAWLQRPGEDNGAMVS